PESHRRRIQRQGSLLQPGADPAGPAQPGQVERKTVAQIDRRGGEPKPPKSSPEPRLRHRRQVPPESVGGRANPLRGGALPHRPPAPPSPALAEKLEAERGAPQPSRDVETVAGAGAAPEERAASSRKRARKRDVQAEHSRRGEVSADQMHPAP